MRVERSISDMLMDLFREMGALEKKAIITEKFEDISRNDMHIINAIGSSMDNTMSKVAKKLGITAGSLTTSVNNLVNKKYISRERGESDRRRVYIYLTEKGQKAYQSYVSFHGKLSSTLLNSVKEEEVSVLMKALNNVNDFLWKYKD